MRHLYRRGRGERQIRQTKANTLASTIARKMGPQPLTDLLPSLNDEPIQKTWAIAEIDASDLFRNREIRSLGWMNCKREGNNWSLSGWVSKTNGKKRLKDRPYSWAHVGVQLNEPELLLKRGADVILDSNKTAQFNNCVCNIQCGCPSEQ